MIRSTLCYIEKDGCYLMLYRNKKENDPCEGKWVGIGGKFEAGETPSQCLMREVREETGLSVTDFEFHGIIRFISDTWPDEDMYLYSAHGFDGKDEFSCFSDLPDESGIKLPWEAGKNRKNMPGFECSEGDLYWIPKNRILSLNLWEGDKYFLKPLIEGRKIINMTCRYEGHKCVEVKDEEICD